MICLLASAKTFSSDLDENVKSTKPLCQNQAEFLVNKLQTLSAKELESFFKVSEKLANENYERYANWQSGKAGLSLSAYNGAAFKSLKHKKLSKENWEAANRHIVIFSGFYGVLRATDRIKPHRLEMATKTQSLIGQNLYNYWKEAVTESLNQIIKETGAKYILNLASEEYFSVIDKTKIKIPIIDVGFKSENEKGLRTIAIHAKMARGRMARFVLDNELENPEKLKEFSFNGYAFDQKLSTKEKLMFINPQKKI